MRRDGSQYDTTVKVTTYRGFLIAQAGYERCLRKPLFAWDPGFF